MSGARQPTAPVVNRFEQVVSDLATPAVLHDNPFRALGLPTDASGVDLRRAAEHIRIRQRLAEGAEAGEAGDAEAALRRLRDPFRRLADELLWLWPDHAPGAKAHNEAIRHLEAFVDGDGPRRPALCAQAVRSLAAVLRAPITAGYLADRATALADLRLSPSDGRRLLAEAERLVPLLAFGMAVRLHEAGDPEAAVALAKAVRMARRGPARSAASEALAPVVSRVRSVTRAAAAERGNGAALGAASATRLLERTTGDLRLVRDLLDQDDPLRVGLVDEVVQRVIECVVPFYLETRDHEAALGALRAARDLGPGPGQSADLDECISLLASEQESSRCWFCGADEAGPDEPYEVRMHGDIVRSYRGVTWRTVTIPIPQCPDCCRGRQREGLLVTAGCLASVAWAVAFVAMLVSGFAWQPPLAAWLAGLAFFAWAYRRWRGPAVGPLTAHPRVAAQREKGWRFGPRPAGVR